MSIGQKIKAKRQEKGWSQRELAQKMGYTHHSTLARIETGKVDVSQTRIVQFSEVLNVSVAYLMGWEEEIEKNPVEAAERHFEILMDADIAEMFEEFKTLDSTKRKIVKDLVHSLAETQKTEV